MKTLTSFLPRLEPLAPPMVRIGIGLVLLWFSVNQFMSPEAWSRMVPSYATTLTGLSSLQLVQLNASFELVLALALIIGLFVRVAGLLAALHIFQIVTILGYNAIGVRDFGLAVAALSVFFRGSDAYATERLFLKK